MRPLFQIETVRAEIETAFGDLPMPDASELLGPTMGYAEEENAIRQALKGRRWQELDVSFCESKWAAFGYLSAIGYRYYLPALLLTSLDNFYAQQLSLEETERQSRVWANAQNLSSEELFSQLRASANSSDILHSTLYDLKPRYYELYTKGHEAHFTYQTSEFSPEQYKTVCSFLGLVMQQIPDMEFSAAKALFWRWNQYEHPALEKAREYYQVMRHFQWPVSKDPAIQRVIEQIHEGFKKTPYPEEMDGNQHEICVGDNEAADILWEFRGQNWHILHPDFLTEHYTALSFLPDGGFRYFLPAFLIAVLMSKAIEFNGNADPDFYLTHGLADERWSAEETIELMQDMDEGAVDLDIAALIKQDSQTDWHSYALKRFSGFTKQERYAVAQYLRFGLEQIDELEKEFPEYAGSDFIKHQQLPIQQALERFWLR